MKNRKLICKICEFSCGKRDKFEKHLKELHNYANIEEAWASQNDTSNLCSCGCGEKTSFINWHEGFSKFVNGHNGNVYKSYDENIARSIVEKRREKLVGRTGWSKGLTKDNSEIIASSSSKISKTRKEKIASGDISIWSKGLTKMSNNKLYDISIKTKRDFSDGIRVSWATGKTASDDERIRKRNEKIRNMFSSGEISAWHAGSTAETNERLKKKCEAGRDNTFAHKFRLKKEEVLERLSSLKNIELLDKDLANYRNSNLHTLKFRCTKCDNISYESLQTATTDRCRLCDPYASKAQMEIHSWIVDLGFGDAFINNRVSIKPYELDVYVPSKMFAVEFNGLYYHNDKMITNSMYHERKLIKAWGAGISMMHIFEDEWSDRKDIVKSMIMQKLGVTGTKIGARKCLIKTMSIEERRSFFNENHLEGDVNSTVAFSLVHNGDIIAGLSLRKPFHKKRFPGTIEIGRFCTKVNTSVAGALSKLLRRASEWCNENGYSRIITYVDKRIGDGTSYETAGMKYCYDTEPRFWWTDKRRRFNRFKFKAAKGITEREVAESAGVTRIYGCKNKVYSLSV